MYRDTEQAYRGWTLDVYQANENGPWYCDYWLSGRPERYNTIECRKRKEAIAEAQSIIDQIIIARSGVRK